MKDTMVCFFWRFDLMMDFELDLLINGSLFCDKLKN